MGDIPREINCEKCDGTAQLGSTRTLDDGRKRVKYMCDDPECGFVTIVTYNDGYQVKQVED